MSEISTLDQVLNVLRQNRPKIAGFGVSRIGVFGSFAHGEQTEASDIDILVEFQRGRKSFKSFIDLAYFLQDLLGREVELVTPESLSPYLKQRILEETDYVQVA